MVKMEIEYAGDLRCVARHGPSGSTIETDAPADNHGKAQRFSPTDLVGAALGTCIATVLGIAAQRKGWDLRGMRLEVAKEMSSTPPRRIARLDVHLWMPVALPEEDRKRVEQMAHSCPVHKSLPAELDAPITIHWP
jgi:putative redox protein